MTRQVTEQDFRYPEFRDAKSEDYEFRNDGALARKDRWETGVRRIANSLGISSRDGFEVQEVCAQVDAAIDRTTLKPISEWKSELNECLFLSFDKSKSSPEVNCCNSPMHLPSGTNWTHFVDLDFKEIASQLNDL